MKARMLVFSSSTVSRDRDVAATLIRKIQTLAAIAPWCLQAVALLVDRLLTLVDVA